MRSESTMTESAKDRQLGPLASFVRAAEPLEELTPGARARIRYRLQATLFPSHRPAALFRWSTVLAALGLLLAGGAVFAAAGHFGLIPWPREARPRMGSEQPASQARRRPAPGVSAAGGLAPESNPAVAPPTSAPQPATRPGPAPTSSSSLTTRATHSRLTNPAAVAARPVARVARASHGAPAAGPASLDGQAMIAQAMRSLRNDRDPEAALEILTQHAALFPQSPLNSERSVLEVEALLTLGRRDEALLRLDGMSLDDTPRSTERHVVRGELRARAQRWKEAAADFDQALAYGQGSQALQERALWGRAATRTHTGDQEGARADLEIYLRLYPTGRFASEAARLLANLR